MNKLTIMVVEPQGNGEIRTIDNTLQNLQEIVGGHIEVIRLESDLLLICNEEGKLMGLSPNRKVGNDMIVGTFFVCKDDGEDFGSLTDTDIQILREQHFQEEVDIMNELKMELVQTNEAVETIAFTLDSFGYDKELVEQLRKLIDEKARLMEAIRTLN